MGDPSKISVGDNVSVHQHVVMISAGEITIGNNVAIAHGCSLVTTEHTWGNADTPIKYNPVKLAPINIANDVWIGCGARILSGVSIKERAVIAAGAVVSKSCESNFIYGGVPARVIKEI